MSSYLDHCVHGSKVGDKISIKNGSVLAQTTLLDPKGQPRQDRGDGAATVSGLYCLRDVEPRVEESRGSIGDSNVGAECAGAEDTGVVRLREFG